MEQLSNRRVVGRPDDSGERFAWNRITASECAYPGIITPDFAWPDQKTCYISLRIFSKNFNAA